MGVPKFFRYISERYPCLSELVREYQIPDFDNLYLDMNGIIHTCSHPDDADPHFRISEEKMFQDIFHYIEVLFRMIKPRKLFFMAVDGVAPRAKMNQQRARRFRSAKEAEKQEEKARKRGEVLPTEARFDSNCITPGTVFMTKLHEQLKYFIVYKISTDKLWQRCEVILSGHETPGEGEHKIMDYIRYLRSRDNYDPNTRHCLYGLDADLIMLGLCTHEPHFSLLREEVKFGKKSSKRKPAPEELKFYLLHLSLMREYLELEFKELQNKCLNFDFNIENIIDDWVLMGFLVGNDFIPHLPNLHIANGALPILYKTYIEILPSFEGYINEGGTLNLDRFEKFMDALSQIDIENFRDHLADLKYFEAKTGRQFSKSRNNEEKPSDDKEEENFITFDSNSDGNSEEEEDDVQGFHDEFIIHKKDYYTNKLDYDNVTPDVLKSQAEGYIRAIQWNLHYYYNGVCSWGWYYPHHYAPYISDIKNFSNVDLSLDFELGKPFQPFEQLLAVLPTGSKDLLPKEYHKLMVDDDSPIKDYYPEDFTTDLNGKRQEWEAVVLIPFIDEEKLLNAMEPCNKLLSAEELARNSHGPMLIYKHTLTDLGAYSAPQYFPNIKENHALCSTKTMEDISVPIENLVKGAYPGTKKDLYYVGFPTLKHLQFTHDVCKARVKVHEHPSREESFILNIVGEDLTPTSIIAKNILGRTVYVSWPHLIEALVVEVADEEHCYKSTGRQGEYNLKENDDNWKKTWELDEFSVREHYNTRLGVRIGETRVLVYVHQMVGRKYIYTQQGAVTLQKKWAKVLSPYPLQAIVQNLNVHNEKYSSFRSIFDMFPTGSVCFMLGQPLYGSLGEVKNNKEIYPKGKIRVTLRNYEEPMFNAIVDLENELKFNYTNAYNASTKLAISKNLFTRITGSVFVTMTPKSEASANQSTKINVGLNLKFSKRNEEIPGYTKREKGNFWLYSYRAVDLVKDYMNFCPELFTYLASHNEPFYSVDDLFPDGNGKEKLDAIVSWLKNQPYYSIERRPCDSSALDPDIVKKIEEIVDKFNVNHSYKEVTMQVKPNLLYKAELNIGNVVPDPGTKFEIYDRVVNVRENYTVPLGLRGTIIAIHQSPDNIIEENMYDVVFDEPFLGGLSLNCSDNRGYRLPTCALINKSHGLRELKLRTGKVDQYSQKSNVPQASNNLLQYPYSPENSAFVSWYNNQLPVPFLPQNITIDYRTQATDMYRRQVSQSQLNQQRRDAQPTVFPRNDFQPNFMRGKNDVQSNVMASSLPDKFAKMDLKHIDNTQTIKIDTDFLKKLLKIGTEKNEPKHNSVNTSQKASTDKPSTSKLLDNKVDIDGSVSAVNSVKKKLPKDDYVKGTDDRKETEIVFNSVKLLNFYQSNGFGCPHYSYFDFPNKNVQAQLINPIDGTVVCGDVCSNKMDACDSVAEKLLKIISQSEKLHSHKIIPPSSQIPPPPADWWKMNTNQTDVHRGDKNEETSRTVVPAFVPLQAVKNIKNKTPTSEKSLELSEDANTCVSVKNTAEGTSTEVDEEPKVCQPPNNTSNEPPKRQRERKIRIAAKFPVNFEF